MYCVVYKIYGNKIIRIVAQKIGREIKYLGDTAGSVPDYCNKADTAIK